MNNIDIDHFKELSFCFAYFHGFLVFFEGSTSAKQDIPNPELGAVVAAIVAVMEVMEVIVGAKGQYLNGGPAEVVSAVTVMSIVQSEDYPNGGHIDVNRTE